jgi:hypothetical protein
MRALSLGAVSVADALRAVSGLGAHRYVAGRLHLVHAFAFAAVPAGAVAEGRAWALELLGQAAARGIDAGSRDEALWRRSTEAEIVAVLGAFWTPGPLAAQARASLRHLIEAHDLPAPNGATPFDEAAEETMHPLLVDAGWELLPLRSLDPERHKGAIAAYGDPLAFASAVFEEETAIPPSPSLLELPAIGATELLFGADEDGNLVEPLVVWADGPETYVDYLVRGVRKAARLPERDAPEE